jgi:hypothetical protein
MPTPTPLALSDAEITMIMQCSRPLQPDDRSRFIELVAAKVRGAKEIGEGEVWRACVEAQRALFSPPIDPPRAGKYR